MLCLLFLVALISPVVPTVKSSGTCNAACVCDGLDLSALAGKSFGTIGVDAQGLPVLGWEYKVSVCQPLSADQLAETACVAKTQPRIVRYKLGENSSDTRAADCEDVGQDVVEAVASYSDPGDGLGIRAIAARLVYASSFGGESHIVIANIACDRTAGSGVSPEGVKESLVDGVKTYEFEWKTEDACVEPKLACDKCVQLLLCADVHALC